MAEARPKTDVAPLALSLRFDGDEAAVRAALVGLEGTLAQAGIAADLGHRAQIVMAEVFNNIVEHAYGAEGPGMVAAEVAYHDGRLDCEVRDTGRAMPDGPLPGDTFPDLDPDAPETLPEGGFGWAIVRELTDELSYSRAGGENVLRFRIASHPDSAD